LALFGPGCSLSPAAVSMALPSSNVIMTSVSPLR